MARNLLWSLLGLGLCLSSPAYALDVRSPNGDIVVKILGETKPPPKEIRKITSEGVVEVEPVVPPSYQVWFKGKEVITTSNLGFEFEKRRSFGKGFYIVDQKKSKVDESWEQPWGERRVVRDHHNSLEVVYASTHDKRDKFAVEFRVFDDGLGFRIKSLAKGRTKINITRENTEIAIAQSDQATAWWIPAGLGNRYEYEYETTPLHKALLVHTPVTIAQAPDVYLSLHEAALVDYSGMSLHQHRPGRYRTKLSPWSDGILVKTKAGFKTPWRTIQISSQAHDLLNSDLILNLNEPNKLGDVSWIEPGRYIGIWWGMHIGKYSWGSGETHGATTENTMRHLDFASKYGFSGVLVEGWNLGWDNDWYNNGAVMNFTTAYKDYDFPRLAQHAKEKGVRLVGHHETSGHVSNYEDQMDDSFALFEKRGIREVKTGYVADAGDIIRIDRRGKEHREWHDGQYMVAHFIRNLNAAAEHKISIISHEPVKDTGLRRTYPNWVSREGARGMEYNAWGNPPNSPRHTTILPFTRMLSGPMDFTAGVVDLMPKGEEATDRVQTTLAKQLALYVVLYAPFQMAADLPENYLKRPLAFGFIRTVPTDWEKSIALAGEVGEYAVFARLERGGSRWYLGAITNEDSREIKVDLGFLGAGKYTARIHRDGKDASWDKNPYAFEVIDLSVEQIDTLEFNLGRGGGVAVVFTKQGESAPLLP